MGHQGLLGKFLSGDDLVSSYARKILKKVIKRLTALQVVKERADGDARANKGGKRGRQSFWSLATGKDSRPLFRPRFGLRELSSTGITGDAIKADRERIGRIGRG
jgi:hypothetical protein